VKRVFIVSPFVFLASVILSAQTYKGTATCEFEFDMGAKTFKQVCREAAPGPTPTPTPVPTPTPTPTPPGPVVGPDGNYPLPANGACPAHFAESFDRVGASFRSRAPVKTQGGVYLGWRYNFDATPKSKPPFCPHASGRLTCEQWVPCQPAAGFDFYLTLPGKFTNERCDNFSAEPYWCHHKPKSNERGPTTVCAVPKGAGPNDPRGGCVTVNVQP
jgi:hypothetical protein